MSHRRTVAALATAGSLALATAVAGSPAPAAQQAPTRPDVRDSGFRPLPVKTPTAHGYGGAVSTVDPEATRVGLQVLKNGGNAADAAVAAAAAVSVTEPYSAGIGGGGFFVYYDARTKTVKTIDGRETAPAAMPNDAFIDPATGEPYNFFPELVTSGVSVGAPGTVATWERVAERWGTRPLAALLRPSITLARRGFVVDRTFRQQTLDNKERFEAFPASSDLFLPNGDAPVVGTRFRNPDMADTYQLIARRGADAFYHGDLAREIADNVRNPRVSPDTELPVPAGYLTAEDLARYHVVDQEPTKMSYREYDVYGMAPSSSGGTTVGGALEILDNYDLAGMSDVDALHHYLEASALAFADRAAYLGDARYVDVPVDTLLSEEFADSRACHLDPNRAAPKPVAAGELDGSSDCTAEPGTIEHEAENLETTNLTVSDKWGNIAQYTLTIEQTGGSGMVVPGRGFLLNNELTDFSTTYDADDPNRIQGGKRPRSSMTPTIVFRDGRPFIALGSPGGSTIITTVLQMMVNRIDLGMTIEEAMAAPRASPRNTSAVTSEPEFITRYGTLLEAYGHKFQPAGDSFTSAAEIGAATALEFHPDGSVTAVAEPSRRGGGDAGVVRPSGD